MYFLWWQCDETAVIKMAYITEQRVFKSLFRNDLGIMCCPGGNATKQQ
jgi:hypothetical protein